MKSVQQAEKSLLLLQSRIANQQRELAIAEHAGKQTTEIKREISKTNRSIAMAERRIANLKSMESW
jgi:hypothetical protein